MKNYDTATEPKTQILKRPRMISALIWGILLISAFHLFKFVMVLITIEVLQILPLNVSPVYLAGDGLFWGISGIFLSWSLWTGKSWSRAASYILSVGYCLVFWIDRIWIAEPELISQRWPVNLTLTIIGLGFIIFILAGKPSREYFRKNPVKIP